MTSRPLDFESSAYASSATSARSRRHGTACAAARGRLGARRARRTEAGSRSDLADVLFSRRRGRTVTPRGERRTEVQRGGRASRDRRAARRTLGRRRGPGPGDRRRPGRAGPPRPSSTPSTSSSCATRTTSSRSSTGSCRIATRPPTPSRRPSSAPIATSPRSAAAASRAGWAGSPSTRPWISSGPGAAGRPSPTRSSRTRAGSPRPRRTSSPRRKALAAERSRALAAALAALPFEQRNCIVLYDVEGYDYAEIARIMGVSVGTVKSRIHRGRLALRARPGAGQGTVPWLRSSEEM